MNTREQIKKIKKRVKTLHLVVTLSLIANGVIWFSVFLSNRQNVYVWLPVGLSCFVLLIAIIISLVLIEMRIKRHLKTFVETYVGKVSNEDIETARILHEKWGKHYLKQVARIDHKIYKPYDSVIFEDLKNIRKGIKTELTNAYIILRRTDYGEEANQLLKEIQEIVERNSYTIDS